MGNTSSQPTPQHVHPDKTRDDVSEYSEPDPNFESGDRDDLSSTNPSSTHRFAAGLEYGNGNDIKQVKSNKQKKNIQIDEVRGISKRNAKRKLGQKEDIGQQGSQENRFSDVSEEHHVEPAAEQARTKHRSSYRRTKEKSKNTVLATITPLAGIDDAVRADNSERIGAFHDSAASRHTIAVRTGHTAKQRTIIPETPEHSRKATAHQPDFIELDFPSIPRKKQRLEKSNATSTSATPPTARGAPRAPTSASSPPVPASTPLAQDHVPKLKERQPNAGTLQKKAKRKSNPEPRHPKLNGPFTKEERQIVDSIFQSQLTAEGLTDNELRTAIKSWRSAEVRPFKEILETTLIARDKASIRKFCQRAYSVENRKGPWTPDEDDSLRRAFTVHPDRWQKIAELVGRRGEDCRDRWRNTVLLKNPTKGPWSLEEEDRLRQTVLECIKRMKDYDEKSGIQAHLLDQIDWNVVSASMDRTRSAKYCREKFQKLQQRSARYTTLSTQRSRELLPSTSKPRRRAVRDLRRCGIGDVYDALVEIVDSIPDRKTKFADMTTFWSLVSVHNKDSRFSSTLRRRLFDRAAREPQYDYDESDTYAEAAATMKEAMERIHGHHVLAEHRTYTATLAHELPKSTELVQGDDDESSASDSAIWQSAESELTSDIDQD